MKLYCNLFSKLFTFYAFFVLYFILARVRHVRISVVVECTAHQLSQVKELWSVVGREEIGRRWAGGWCGGRVLVSARTGALHVSARACVSVRNIYLFFCSHFDVQTLTLTPNIKIAMDCAFSFLPPDIFFNHVRWIIMRQ